MNKNIKIYVANLAAYNAGKLKGTWFTLPVGMDEIFEEVFESHELDENEQPFSDYAIHDYEAPFEINEFDSIETLNEMAELIESAPQYQEILSGKYSPSELVTFAEGLGYDNSVNDIVPYEVILSSLKQDIEKGNIYSIKAKLQDVSYSSVLSDDGYFILEGDGNFRSITQDDLDVRLEEIFEYLKSDC